MRHNKQTTRDYSYIVSRLSKVYDISAGKKDLMNFENSSKYNTEMSNTEYVKAYVKHEMSSDVDMALDEDVACVNVGNVSGMGAVVTPIAGAVPGTTGTTGSGDIGSGWSTSINNNKNIRSRDSLFPRSRRKSKMKAALKQSTKNFNGTKNVPFQVNPDNTVDNDKKTKSNIKSFSEFQNKNESVKECLIPSFDKYFKK
jgi:hypothetical protein